jgi:RNA-directed DNA polymerase
MTRSTSKDADWLGMLEGHYAYFAVPTNIGTVRAVRHHVKVRWYLSLRRRSQRRLSLRRRSQRRRLSWPRMNVLAAKFLPPPRVLHPWAEQRFLVRHRRQEPDA